MKTFKGKAIYNPSGKAAEYAKWACNFYTGCSNDCDYCYCKRGVMSHVWTTTPQLKKCFKDEAHAMEVFEKELMQNLPELQKHGLFFSFTTDPMLEETHKLTWEASCFAMENDVPVKILTKCVGKWVDQLCTEVHSSWKDLLVIGFTLTRHDEKEKGASTNQERIESIKDIHNAGFKTFASIEPIINIVHSKLMIERSAGYCHLYKIGLESGKKYDKEELVDFISWCGTSSAFPTSMKFYFKDSFLAQAQVDRTDLPANCVPRDYNIFDNKN